MNEMETVTPEGAEFEARASLRDSAAATGLVMAVGVTAIVLVVSIHSFLAGPTGVALDTAVAATACVVILVGLRRIARELPYARVYADRVTGLLSAPPVVWFRDLTGYRKEVERSGIGPWTAEHVLWLRLGDTELRVGNEWTNHRELQAELLRRVGPSVPRYSRYAYHGQA